MDVYTVTDYKTALQERLKEQRKRGLPWSARRLAMHLKLQPTYLSRIFHSVDQHLSEEDLWLAAHAMNSARAFKACEIREFYKLKIVLWGLQH